MAPCRRIRLQNPIDHDPMTAPTNPIDPQDASGDRRSSVGDRNRADSSRERELIPGDATAHRRTRRDHSSETAEDYAEAIADIIHANGRCRVADLTRRFGVSHVTVTRIVARLVRDGLATTEPYRPILLTPRGRRLAQVAQRRHEIVFRFLLAIGVDPKTAAIDAEGIEHHVSPATLRVMERWQAEREADGA